MIMKQTSRTEFRSVAKNLRISRPLETVNRSVMQWVDDEGIVQAQVVYTNKYPPTYYVREDIVLQGKSFSDAVDNGSWT